MSEKIFALLNVNGKYNYVGAFTSGSAVDVKNTLTTFVESADLDVEFYLVNAEKVSNMIDQFPTLLGSAPFDWAKLDEKVEVSQTLDNKSFVDFISQGLKRLSSSTDLFSSEDYDLWDTSVRERLFKPAFVLNEELGNHLDSENVD